jgi:hypothetical protein
LLKGEVANILDESMMKFPHFYSQFTLTALTFGLFAPAFGQERRIARDGDAPERVTLSRSTDGRVLSAKFQSPEYSAERILHDSDGDGWCDLWKSMFPQLEHRSKKIDTDGDGLTDFEEMVLMRDPTNPGPMPRHLTEEELAEAKRLRQEKQARAEAVLRIKHAEKLLAGHQALLASQDNVGEFKPDKIKRLQKMEKASQQMTRAFERDLPLIQQKSMQLDPQLKALGISAHSIGKSGKVRLMATDNVDAADTIYADELWPMGSSELPDVTGSGVTVGVWEAGGGIFSNHVEFGSRIIEGDTAMDLQAEQLDQFHFHATAVAGTLAATGLDADARGVAYEANLKSFGSVGDYSEMMTEAMNGMVFSNHSYSPPAGWIFFGGSWRWLGPSMLAGKDPVFGNYDEDSRNIDIVSYVSKTYLSVHSSSNEADDWGPISDINGVIAAGQLYLTNEDLDNDGFLDVSSLTHPSDGGLPQPGSQIVDPDDPNDPNDRVIPRLGLGFCSIKTTGSAKNNLSVGSIQDIIGGASATTDASVVPSSSRGPTLDGRVKPDLVGNGDGIYSPSYNQADPTDINFYDDTGGTSFSTPTITGGLTLLHNINTARGGPDYLSSTWKALLLNTTVDGTSLPAYYGTDAAAANLVGPDYIYGWGVADIERAGDLLAANLETKSKAVHLKEHILYDGNTIEIPVQHDGVSSEMKVMICWTDAPFQDNDAAAAADEGVPDVDVGPGPNNGTDIRLINDLDLRIIAPDGSTLMPWTLDVANPLNAAVPGNNIRDNVEQIIITAPAAGEYTVQISHKGTLKASELVQPGEVGYDATTLKYRLESGREQNVSVAISGNKELSTDGLSVFPPTVIGTSVLLEFQSLVGIRYQLESSDDLDSWTDEGGPVNATQNPQPLTLTNPVGTLKKFYRYREITPLGQ